MMQKSVSTLLVAIMLALLLSPIPSPAQTPSGAGWTIPVSGSAQGAGRLTGTFTIHRFVATGDPANPVGATGTLSLQTASGRNVVTQVTMPVTRLASPGAGTAAGAVAIQQATCEILELTLGPLDLNLLGLVVHLDQVHLTIDANPAGGLLGQLLCAIANLLTPGGGISGAIADLVAALNQLLALLGGLGL
jgi:hypothetical protein